MADGGDAAVLVPVRDQETDRLTQRLGHSRGGVAVTGLDIELDAGDRPIGDRQRAGLECENGGRCRLVDR